MNIVLFDGVCNFCDSSVKLIIKFDKKNVFKFASQQSDIGKKMLFENGYSQNHLDTIVFINENQVFTKSDAIIEICNLLNGLPKLLLIMKILPKKYRDMFYEIFARHRYQIFGKKNECMIPSSEIRSKFL